MIKKYMNELFFIVHNADKCESANNKFPISQRFMNSRTYIYIHIMGRSVFFVNYVYFYSQIYERSRFVSDKHTMVFQPMFVKRELGFLCDF